MGRESYISVLPSRQRTRMAYNHLSRWYDWFSSGSELLLVRLGLQTLNLAKGDKVLDIGFGTGEAILEMAGSVGNSGNVFGIDISTGMFKVTKRKIQKMGISEQIQLNQADAISLPFSGNSFDAVFSSFTLELFENHEIIMVLNECHRVLKNGGHLGLVTMAAGENENLSQKIYSWFHDHIPMYFDCRGINIQFSLTRCGFQVIDVVPRSIWGLPITICLARKV